MGKKTTIRIDKNISVGSDDGCWWATTMMMKYWGKTESHCEKCPFSKCIEDFRGKALRKFLIRGRAFRKFLVDEMARIEKEHVL